MMPDESNQIDRHRSKELEDAEASLPEKLLRTPTKTFETEEQSSSLEVVEGDVISDGEENVESEIDVTGGDDTLDELDDVVMPAVTNDGELVQNVGEKTPTKEVDEETDSTNAERVFSSFPCQVIPETLSRMTRTPPDGEHLQVHRNSNGRLRIYVIDHTKKFSPYSNLTHKPCTVCNRMMRSGEMHLNFPADLDRRRIWANLLGFKYKDILRSKMGPISFSIAAGPICTEHFAEECFRNHNFNKSAIEAFGVPVAISPDVKTTPSKKRVPWVCTICEFHSCSVVELQTHLLDHTEEMLKKKESVSDDFQVPEAGFMCPFCRKCTYGYKTISGYRRHLNAAPIHHCHLRRIYEFAKMNCRSTELEPIDKWDNWTRRNVYVAYHGCEPPVNEIVLTPSPTKSAYVQNPEERTRLVHDEERRRKAVRSLAFVGKEGGTSVNDHNVMQRAVYLQVRRNLEHSKRYPEPEEIRPDETKEDGEQEKEAVTVAEKEGEKRVEEEEDMGDEDQEVLASPQLPMGSVPTEEPRKSRRLAVTSSSAASSPCKSPEPLPSTSSLPVTPIKNRRKVSSEERSVSHDDSPAPQTGDPRERLRQKLRDEQYAKMVAKRAQQVKRLISYKTFKKEQPVPKKPRKAMNYTVSVKSEGEDGHRSERHGEVDDEEYVTSTTTEQTIEPTTSSSIPTTRKSARCAKKVESFQNMEKARETSASPVKPKIPKEPEERPLKSMLARSFAAGVRPSMAKYQVPIDSFSTTISGRSLSSGAISSKSPRDSSSPEALGTISSSTGGNSVGGGLFARVLRAQAQDKAPAKRPTLLARRPLILSPRKKASTSLVNHESSPIIPSSAIEVVDEEILIYAKEMDVDVVEEEVITEATIDDVAATSSDNDKPVLTLAEALELKGDDGVVNNQELEEISKELMKDPGYYRSVEDAFKLRTATKIRADMRLSRHCMRQIEAARARARLFGEGNEDQYQIYYSNDGAQVVSKNDPKWRKLQQQQQFPGDEEEQE